MIPNVAAGKPYGVLMTAGMGRYVRFVASALVAAALLFAPTASAGASCGRDASDPASLVLAVAHHHASSARADCDDHSAPSPRAASHGAPCAAICGLLAVTSVNSPNARRATESNPLVDRCEMLVAGLAIPPLLGPPRT